MKLFAWILGVSMLLILVFSRQAAASQSGVVIAQVMPNGTTATQEYVSIYNTSDNDVDVTDWCIKYNGSSSKPGCMPAPDARTRLYLAAHTYTTFSTSDFISAHPGFVPQARTAFTAGLADARGTLTITDQSGVVQDQFTWANKIAPGNLYQRVDNEQGVLQDTDIDSIDFASVAFVLLAPEQLGLYEATQPADLCPNLPDTQDTIPEGHIQDDLGDCVEITQETAVIDITEILPNPTSYDTGLEFVELYNPNDHQISIAGYRLELGPAYSKSYTFPTQIISPGGYLVLTDSVLGFSLPNSNGSVRIINASGQLVSQTSSYGTAPEAETWALINDTWEFTAVPTPGGANESTPVDQPIDSGNVASLQPCPAGKYRSPDTNRCRSITTSTNTLKPCATDEYRYAATNRCRKLATLSSSSLTPCKPGQVRNPDTNRCRNITASTSVLSQCEEGYERNSDTNRCRKVVTGPTQFIDESAQSRTPNNVLIGIVLILTAGYGVYEYRYDVANQYHKLRMMWQKRQAGRATQKAV